MIKKIELKNFKCYEEISLECRELNLFTGVNGMGKYCQPIDKTLS